MIYDFADPPLTTDGYNSLVALDLVQHIHNKDLYDMWAKPLRVAALRRDGVPFLMFADHAEERGHIELALKAREVGERIGES